MTHDPTVMTADEIEALVGDYGDEDNGNWVSVHELMRGDDGPWNQCAAELIAAAPALALRLASVLRENERLREAVEGASMDLEKAETDMRCVIDFLDRDGRLDLALSHARAAILDYQDAYQHHRKALEAQ